MGKKVKTGKNRLDKFYKLAKEQGYRARSAFKLIQLNKKYDFLAKTKCAIDLCAAPGGWMQVCAKYMPVSSLIIGVDLVPIRPIKNCISLQEDITTEKCRKSLRREMKTWKADLVLNDGAPNVGSAWVQDAFTQSDLSLAALKLATEFLGPGGMFISKVFRSQDYNAYLWVCNQFFRKVEVTKPKASRNESAEIYVIDVSVTKVTSDRRSLTLPQDYLAPAKIDERLLDTKHIFDMIDQGKPKAVNVLKQQKEVRKREGYEEGATILFQNAPISEFVFSEDPIDMLSRLNKLDFDADDESKILAKAKHTTEDLKHMFNDLRVLGKSDFKLLLKWRLKSRELLRLLRKKKAEKEGMTADLEDDEEEEAADTQKDKKFDEMDDDEKEMVLLEAKQRKAEIEKQRQKRREKEKKLRYQSRQALRAQAEVMDVQTDMSLFDLTKIKKKGDVDALDSKRATIAADILASKGALGNAEAWEDLGTEGDEDGASSKKKKKKSKKVEEEEEDDEDEQAKREAEWEANLDALYEEYCARKGLKKKRVKIGKKKKEEDDNEDDIAFNGDTIDAETLKKFADEVDYEELDEKDRNPLLYSQALLANGKENGDQNVASKAEVDASLWYSQKIFDGAKIGGVGIDLDLDDDDYDADEEAGVREDDEEEESTRKENASTTSRVDATSGAKTQKRRAEDMGDHEDDAEFIKNLKVKKRRDAEEQAKLKEVDGFEDEGDESRAKDAKKSTTKDEDEAFEEVKADDYDSEDYDSDEKAEALALGSQLLKKKSREELIDASYNRYSFGDNEVPMWFMDEEQKHNKPHLSITKEMLEKIKEKYRGIDARTTKKVAEAKARQKRRDLRKMEKLKKKATEIADAEDLPARAKMKAIEDLYKKGLKKKKIEKISVVAGKAGKLSRKDMKGKRMKVVDRRQKADTVRGKRGEKIKKAEKKREKERTSRVMRKASKAK